MQYQYLYSIFFIKFFIVMNSNRLYFLLIIPFFFVICQVLYFPSAIPSHSNPQIQKSKDQVATNLILKSTDNGHSWQDISKGLPENIEAGNFFVNDKGLYMPAGVEMYHSKSKSVGPIWEKEIFKKDPGTITVCKSGMYAFTYNGNISRKIAGSNTWSLIYENFPRKNLRTIFETSSGAVLIGCDSGLFKFTNKGKTWQHVRKDGWVIKIVESKGVLIATDQNGIIRSNDDGQTWNLVVSEGGVGIDVTSISSGFAVITYNTDSKTRRVRASVDGGKTWQPIDADLPAHDLIANILQVGDNFFCGHPKGIFRSIDRGKTWQLILPSIGTKVFNLSRMGKVIYAFPKNGGC